MIGAFILYGILRVSYPSSIIPVFGGTFSTYYISMSILLAFTATYPDAQVLLYFFIPIKMKWLGLIYGFFIVINFIQSGWAGRVVIIASLLNFILFFLGTRNLKRYSPKEQKRRYDFKKATAPTRVKNGQVTRHKCAVCGRTEATIWNSVSVRSATETMNIARIICFRMSMSIIHRARKVLCEA